MSQITNGNTLVSDPGQSPVSGNAVSQPTGAPGATGAGANMGIGSAAILTIGGAAAGLVALGLIFRRSGENLPALRVDAVNAVNIYFSWLLIDGTLKVLAYRFHGHKLAQAYLLVA